MASPAVERMKEALFTGLDYMAMPGDYLRGALADPGAVLPGGRPVRRTTGRELLEAYGLVSPNQEGFDAGDAAGFATDLLVDPLNVLLGAGAIKGGLKGVRALAGAAKAGKAAESLTAAKEALGAIPGAAMRQSPAIAYSIGAPVGGAYLMANNEEGSNWKDLLGMGLMASPLMLPLAMTAGRKAKAPEIMGRRGKVKIKTPQQKALLEFFEKNPMPIPDDESLLSSPLLLQAEQGARYRQEVGRYTKAVIDDAKKDAFETFKMIRDRSVPINERIAAAKRMIEKWSDEGVARRYSIESGEMADYFPMPKELREKWAAEQDALQHARDALATSPTIEQATTSRPAISAGAGKYEPMRFPWDHPGEVFAMQPPLQRWSKKSVAEALAAEDAKAVQAAGPPTPASYFNEKALKKAEASGMLTYMHPKDFLAMAYPFSFGEQNPVSSATVKKLLESKTPFNTLPELSVQRALQGQSLVTGHEGRHRAQALLDLGVEEMPVVIKMKKGETPQGKLRSQRVENPPVIDFPQLRQARAVLQPGEHGVLPISRPEIDFLEQLGIRDATKWQEIKRMLAGADARTPEAQAVVEKFLPQRGTPVFHGTHSDIQEFVPRQVKSYNSLGTWFTGSDEKARSLYGPKVYESSVPPNARLIEFGADQTDFLKVLGANADIAKKTGHLEEAKSLLKQLPDFEAEKLYDRRLRDEGWSQQLDAEFPGIKQIKKSNAAANSLLKSEKYMTEFRKMVESAGYDGIVWRKSNIDTTAGDSPHDVYVIFNKSSMPASKK